MRWRVYLSSVLVVFLSLCFGSFIINQKNSVSAISDYSYTFDFNSIPSWYKVCGNSSSDPALCSDYSYVIFEPATTCSGSASFYVTGLAFNVNTLVSACAKSIYPLSSSSMWLTGGNAGSASGNITITLTESLVSCPGAPSGSITLTENGTFDVTNYAEAVVDVPPEIQQGDYHDDLVSLKQAIVIVPAVALVIYFLYAIYKMLLGGKTL